MFVLVHFKKNFVSNKVVSFGDSIPMHGVA